MHACGANTPAGVEDMHSCSVIKRTHVRDPAAGREHIIISSWPAIIMVARDESIRLQSIIMLQTAAYMSADGG